MGHKVVTFRGEYTDSRKPREIRVKVYDGGWDVHLSIAKPGAVQAVASIKLRAEAASELSKALASGSRRVGENERAAK